MYSVAKTFKSNKNVNSFQLTDRCNNSHFANISADIFLKICDYLDLPDICRAGRVCVRWYLLIRGEYVWNRTDLVSLNLTPDKEQKLLSSLPPSISHLRIGFPPGSIRHPMKLPTLLNQTSNFCSSLSSLVIENTLLQRLAVTYISKTGYMLNCKTPVQEQVYGWFVDLRYDPDDPEGGYLPLCHRFPTLKILSLRFTVFAVEDIFPRENAAAPESQIEVLDLTRCPCTLDKHMVAFCRFPYLEELYLSGTAVTVNGVLKILKSLRHLKILDLDETVVGSETFSVLKIHGRKLVHIYLGGTVIKDEHLADVDATCFPRLRKICLRRTRVSQVGIDKLLSSLPALEHVLLPEKAISLGWLLDQDDHVRSKLISCGKEQQDGYCNHFLENRYGGNFKSGKMP